MRYNMRFLFLVIMLLSAAINSGCFSNVSKIKVSVRNSVTHEPITVAKVRAFCPVYQPIKIYDNLSDEGSTDKNGIVILNLEEVELLNFWIYPYYYNNYDEKESIYWQIEFGHPAISGNSTWMRLDPDDTRPYSHNLKIADPEMEIIIEKYIKRDEDK